MVNCWWTAVALWPKNGDIEEVDVRAPDRRTAEKRAEVELTELYNPGWKILEVLPR
jgi:hypothetical protein